MSPGEQIRIRVEGFKNPLFFQKMDDFVIETLDGQEGSIEKSAYFDVSVKNPAKIAFA